MKHTEIKHIDIEGSITENFTEIEQEKEQKFVSLMIQIIVSLTLKELYEEGDQISEI